MFVYKHKGNTFTMLLVDFVISDSAIAKQMIENEYYNLFNLKMFSLLYSSNMEINQASVYVSVFFRIVFYYIGLLVHIYSSSTVLIMVPL